MPPRNPAARARTVRLSERLADARRRLLVGRDSELELFRAALKGREPPFAVLHVHGPGGIGKTTLLREYRELAVRAARPVAWLEGQDLDPAPDAFLRALAGATGAGDAGAVAPGTVILVDGYEHLAPLDAWLRQRFLPGLPASCLVVTAGREPPAAAWQIEAEWATLARTAALRNLEPDAAKAYLRRRKVAKAQHDAVLSFTYGHPLALSLVADVLARTGDAAVFDPRAQPDLLRALLERLVRDTPGPEYRRALEICAHARATTESLLAHVLGSASAAVLFDWLRGLSLIEQTPRGLVPHDLVREVLDADLRWRDPDGYRRMHRRIREHVLQRLHATSGIEQQQAFFDLVYLHRGSAAMRPYYSWKTLGQAYAEALAPADHPALLALVCALDGAAGAASVRHWLARQPEAFYVFRGTEGQVHGYAAMLALRDIEAADLVQDALLARVHAYARQTAPLRRGEALLLARFWAREDADSQSAAASLVAMLSTRAWLTTPALGWSFAAPPAPERWQPIFAHLNFVRVEQAEIDLNGRRHGVFAHDWRTEPPAAWLEHMAEREIAADPPAAPPPTLVPARLVLSEPDFARAVRRALRDCTRPALLAANPLLRSRVLLDRHPEGASAADLQALLREGVEALRANPKDEKRYRALWHTFFQPAATQEQAAERLQLPFNTYRYHLYQGIDRLTAWLWRQELHGRL